MFSDWHALGDTSVFYRKWLLYNVNFKVDEKTELDLKEYQLCGSQLGGPLALYKTRPKSNENQNRIFIFSSSGYKFSEVKWQDEKKLAGIGWTDQEHLVVVDEDGNVALYNIHGDLMRSFLLLDVVTSAHVLECQFWGNGVVVLASDYKLYVAEVLSCFTALVSK